MGAIVAEVIECFVCEVRTIGNVHTEERLAGCLSENETMRNMTNKQWVERGDERKAHLSENHDGVVRDVGARAKRDLLETFGNSRDEETRGVRDGRVVEDENT